MLDKLRSSFLWKIITFPFWLISLPFRPFVDLGRKIYHFMTDEPEDKAFGEVVVSVVDHPKDMLSQIYEHVGHLRTHLIRVVVVTLLCIGAAAYFTPQAAEYLAAPVGGLSNLKAIEVTESFNTYMTIALLLGIAAASPYTAFELWLFLAPGLFPRSRQYSLVAIPLASLFFIGGMATTFYLLVPPALPVLMGFMAFETILRPESYFSFLTTLMFWMGIVFEFPLVVFVLSTLGLVRPQMLTAQWRIAVIVIAILAMIITPTSDIINMLIMMLPMLVLYAASIILSALGMLIRRKPSPSGE